MPQTRLQRSLVRAVQGLSAGARRIDLLRAVQSWLRRCLGHFTPKTRAAFGLDDFAELDLSEYPVERSSLDVERTRLRLQEEERTTPNHLAMQLRDVFEEGITIRVDDLCGHCSLAPVVLMQIAGTLTVVRGCLGCAFRDPVADQAARLEPARTVAIEASAEFRSARK